MSRIFHLILHGSLALLREVVRAIARRAVRFERTWMARLADLPAALLDACALFVRAALKGSGEDLFVFAFSAALLLLFLLLR